MTLPREKLKKRNKRFKKRMKKYKPKGWYIGGAHSAHPGLSSGGMGEAHESDMGLLGVEDWDDVPQADKSAMAYELMSERTLRSFIRETLQEADASTQWTHKVLQVDDLLSKLHRLMSEQLIEEMAMELFTLDQRDKLDMEAAFEFRSFANNNDPFDLITELDTGRELRDAWSAHIEGVAHGLSNDDRMRIARESGMPYDAAPYFITVDVTNDWLNANGWVDMLKRKLHQLTHRTYKFDKFGGVEASIGPTVEHLLGGGDWYCKIKFADPDASVEQAAHDVCNMVIDKLEAEDVIEYGELEQLEDVGKSKWVAFIMT